MFREPEAMGEIVPVFSTDRWSDLEAWLDPQTLQSIETEGKSIWSSLANGAPWGVVTMGIHKHSERLLWLKERYGEELKRRLAEDEWRSLETAQADIQEAIVARWNGSEFAEGDRLLSDLGEVGQVRVAPGGRAVAFTIANDDGGPTFRLRVVEVGSLENRQVADNVSAYPDWSQNGLSVLYVQGEGSSAVGDIQLGALYRCRLFGEQGAWLAEESQVSEALAGLVFSPWIRVRNLSDGRVVFNAAQVSLPVSAADAKFEGEQLYALDLERQTTLVPLVPRSSTGKLPESLCWFEPSPDGQRFLIAVPEGWVALFTPAKGRIDTIQTKEKGGEDMAVEPAWRGNDMFAYLRLPQGESKEKSASVEVVLRSLNGDERVLSESWPAGYVDSMNH